MVTLPRTAPLNVTPLTRYREELEAFLRTEGYARSTIRETREALGGLWARANERQGILPSQRAAAGRVRRWLLSVANDQGIPYELRGLGDWLQLQGVHQNEALTGPKTKRSAKLERFDSTGWLTLINALERDRREHPTEVLAIRMLMTSSLRVGQLLNIPMEELRRIFKTKEMQQALDALRHRGSRAGESNETLAQALASSYRAAYVKLHRYVTELRESTGLDFDFYTIYRTPRSVRGV